MATSRLMRDLTLCGRCEFLRPGHLAPRTAGHPRNGAGPDGATQEVRTDRGRGAVGVQGSDPAQTYIRYIAHVSERVLDLRLPGDGLGRAQFLPEYDAIVLNPASVLHLGPGEVIDAPGLFAHLHSPLARRSEELPDFFAAGGVLVASLEPVSQLTYNDFGGVLDSYEWWGIRAELGLIAAVGAMMVSPGHGPIDLITEPGHPFRDYLESTVAYQVRMTCEVSSQAHVTVLAENRIGEAVAIEIGVRAGLIIAVPPPTNAASSALLMSALDRLLAIRRIHTARWKLAAETAVEAKRNAVLSELRAQRDAADSELAGLSALRDDVLRLPAVARAIRYYEQATDGTPTPRSSLPIIYKCIEVIEDAFGGESPAVVALGISNRKLKRIKALANRTSLDIRHAPSATDEPLPISDQDFLQALADTGELLRAFIENRAGQFSGA